jgi:hypothetical protein
MPCPGGRQDSNGHRWYMLTVGLYNISAFAQVG